MAAQTRIQTGPVPFQSSSSSPISSLPEFDFEKRDDISEKLSPLESISPQSLHTKPWPERPQELHNGRHGEWGSWEPILNCVMVMLPLPFFILITAAITVNGKAVTKQQSGLLDFAVKAATTLFPILFGASTGRAAIKFATWRLEQGSNLGHLEQLMGSHSIWSAFLTHFQLRSFNAIGLVLIVIWCFEPIGGQSVQQILTTIEKATTVETTVSYFNSRQQSYSAPSGAFQNQWFPGFSVLFGSALLSTADVKASTEDVWGNVKIPYYSSIQSTGTPLDNEGWIQLPSNFTPIYSSLFGLPISGLQNGNTTFSVETTYMSLSCSNMSVSAQNPPPAAKSDLISDVGPFQSFQNISAKDAWAIGYQGPDVTAHKEGDDSPFVYPKSCPDCLPPGFSTTAFDTGKLAFQEFSGFDNITSIFCEPSQQYIESKIFCIKTSKLQTCRVTAQRLSLLPHMPTTITPLSFPVVVMGLTALLPNSTPQYNAVNMVENFIYNPLTQSTIISGETSNGANSGETPLMSVSPNDFSDRFGQLLNTYMYASMWNSTPYILGAPISGIEANLVGGNNASFIPATSADLIAMIQNQTAAFTVPASITTTSPVYFVFYSWLTVFLIATLVMLSASIVGVYYSRKTIVPDYLGYVSSLAKESQYIRMPDVGVNMDGMDKARMVKDVKVRLGDVTDQEKSPIGKLAFARLEDTKIVQKGRLYI